MSDDKFVVLECTETIMQDDYDFDRVPLFLKGSLCRIHSEDDEEYILQAPLYEDGGIWGYVNIIIYKDPRPSEWCVGTHFRIRTFGIHNT